jgi:hypothetical protein
VFATPFSYLFSHVFSHVFPMMSQETSGDRSHWHRPVAWSDVWSHAPSRGRGTVENCDVRPKKGWIYPGESPPFMGTYREIIHEWTREMFHIYVQ